ncbi:hypothetical protein LY76DRAFT_242711 [Colletotrichum caudatum]|nr:hypothetical protein LY76DRAFT_242711 [Colletotrichum caudatum]
MFDGRVAYTAMVSQNSDTHSRDDHGGHRPKTELSGGAGDGILLCALHCTALRSIVYSCRLRFFSSHLRAVSVARERRLSSPTKRADGCRLARPAPFGKQRSRPWWITPSIWPRPRLASGPRHPKNKRDGRFVRREKTVRRRDGNGAWGQV